MAYEKIEKESIAPLKKQLIELVPKWTQIISDKITKDKNWKTYTDKKCSREIVVNISSGLVDSQLHRRLFVKYATELLAPAIEEQNKQAATAKRWQTELS